MKETVGNDYKPFRRIRVLKIIISPRFNLGKIDCGSSDIIISPRSLQSVCPGVFL